MLSLPGRYESHRHVLHCLLLEDADKFDTAESSSRFNHYIGTMLPDLNPCNKALAQIKLPMPSESHAHS